MDTNEHEGRKATKPAASHSWKVSGRFEEGCVNTSDLFVFIRVHSWLNFLFQSGPTSASLNRLSP